MSYNDPSDAPFFGGLFGWRKKSQPKSPERANQPRPAATTNTKRIVCFRIDDDLDRRLSRALRGKSCSRSDFIRTAIERVLKQDGEERLREAHSAIRWD
jgi:hypothetical protein